MTLVLIGSSALFWGVGSLQKQRSFGFQVYTSWNLLPPKIEIVGEYCVYIFFNEGLMINLYCQG